MDLERSGGRLLRFDEGDVVFREGDEGDSLYIVREGGVHIRKSGEFHTTVLAECGPGEMFGELALIDTQPHSASAVASEDGTELALYDRETFVASIREDPEFALRVIESLGTRLRQTTDQLQRICGEYVRDKAEMTLIQRAVLEGELS